MCLLLGISGAFLRDLMSSLQSTSVVQKTCVVLVGSGVTSGNLLGTSLLVSTA